MKYRHYAPRRRSPSSPARWRSPPRRSCGGWGHFRHHLLRGVCGPVPGAGGPHPGACGRQAGPGPAGVRRPADLADTSDVTEIFASARTTGIGMAIGNRLKRPPASMWWRRTVSGWCWAHRRHRRGQVQRPAGHPLPGGRSSTATPCTMMLETCAPLRDEIGVLPRRVDAAGQLDRRKLGQEVFSPQGPAEQLNDIVARHLVPEVRRLAASESRSSPSMPSTCWRAGWTSCATGR